MTASLFRIAPWLALLGVAWFGGCQYQQNRQLKTETERLLANVRSLEVRAAQVDTVFKTDTLKLTKTRLVTDSVLLVDTLIHRDTVRVLVAAERQACDQALQTCETRVAYRDSIIANLDSALRVQQRRGSTWKTKLGWLLVGAAAGSLIPR